MSKVNFTFLAVMVLFCLTGSPVRADLVSLNSPRFGANSLTLDTRTGLTFLDLPFSLNSSYLDAEAATQPGGQFAGFRHATAQEVLSLFNSAGFDTGFIPQYSPSFQNVTLFISRVGATDAQDGVAGLTGTLTSNGSEYAGLSYGFQNGIAGYYVSALPGPGSTAYGLGTQFPTLGNWLVVVPEPSTGALLLAAAAFGVLVPRRKS